MNIIYKFQKVIFPCNLFENYGFHEFLLYLKLKYLLKMYYSLSYFSVVLCFFNLLYVLSLGLFSHDISSTLEMLGMVSEGPDDEIQLAVDWDQVDAHMKRVAKSKTRIDIDPECLRWTPLIPSNANPFRELLPANVRIQLNSLLYYSILYCIVTVFIVVLQK